MTWRSCWTRGFRPTACSSAAWTARTQWLPVRRSRSSAAAPMRRSTTSDPQTTSHVTDGERAGLVSELVASGYAGSILLSSDAIGYAVGQPARDVPYDHLLASFVPLLKERGIGGDDVQRILVDNPRDLLTSGEAPEATESSTRV